MISILASACASSDRSRLQESRVAFSRGDFDKAEAMLFSPEVFEDRQNRLVHFSQIASIAFAKGEYQKALLFLKRSRDLSIELRSGAGFVFLQSGDYRGNPLEYSWLFLYSVLSNLALSTAKTIPAWSTPAILDSDQKVLLGAENFPARELTDQDRRQFRQSARAELLAWDSHLDELKKTFGERLLYQEDLLARVLASFFHGESSQHSDRLVSDRRTAEILAQQLTRILEHDRSHYSNQLTEKSEIQKGLFELIKQPTSRETKTSTPRSLVLIESELIEPLKKKRYVIGLSTLFSGIRDPGLRRMMEEIGLRVLLQFAPEFGLIALGGGIAGAVSSDDEDGVSYLSDAVDRSFGFEIQFPQMPKPPRLLGARLLLKAINGAQVATEIPLELVSPLQEMFQVELKNREKDEMLARAVSVGGQYLAILIPAILTYQKADRDGNGFLKLGAIAGFYLGKKAIDSRNRADLRSWGLLPQWIHGAWLRVPTGRYQGSMVLDTEKETKTLSLGEFDILDQSAQIIYRRALPLANPVKF